MGDIVIPKFRAHKVGTIDYVKGFLKKCTDTEDILWIQTTEWVDYQITEETLQISFDNVKWFTLEEAERAFNKIWEEGF